MERLFLVLCKIRTINSVLGEAKRIVSLDKTLILFLFFSPPSPPLPPSIIKERTANIVTYRKNAEAQFMEVTRSHWLAAKQYNSILFVYGYMLMNTTEIFWAVVLMAFKQLWNNYTAKYSKLISIWIECRLGYESAITDIKTNALLQHFNLWLNYTCHFSHLKMHLKASEQYYSVMLGAVQSD